MLTATIAGLTVKIIYGLWSNGRIGDQWVDDATDYMQATAQSYTEKRKTERQLDALADSLLEKMQPVVEKEYPGLSDNEKAATLDAVEATLRATRITAAKVIEVDFRSSAFEEVLRSNDKNRTQAAGLNEVATSLYDHLLTECAVYVTNIAAGLPDFTSAQARELLARDTGLRNLSEDILHAIPESSVPRNWGIGREDARFETAFTRFIAEKYNRLELFGISSTAARRPYDLSLAYISLEVTTSKKSTQARSKTLFTQSTSNNKIEENQVETSTRVERILDSHSAILVSGDAGSGKTTLLRWIALNAITASKSGQPENSWSPRVPFIIALRDYVDRPLPQPEHFVEHMAPSLCGTMPTGWAHRVLAEGKGTILVDGLDETSADQREEVYNWLHDIMLTFPEASVLVTSRGTALTPAWKNSTEFFDAELLPMNHAD